MTPKYFWRSCILSKRYGYFEYWKRDFPAFGQNASILWNCISKMSTKLDVTCHSSKIEPDEICTLYVYLKGISLCVCVCVWRSHRICYSPTSSHRLWFTKVILTPITHVGQSLIYTVYVSAWLCTMLNFRQV